MTAGAFGQFIASPTDLVKVQMQMEGKRVLVEGRRPRYDLLLGCMRKCSCTFQMLFLHSSLTPAQSSQSCNY